MTLGTGIFGNGTGIVRGLTDRVETSYGRRISQLQDGRFYMKLREHPLVKKHWPPKWRPFFGSTAPVAGEIGILDEVRPSVLSNRCCFVLMDFGGKKYIAELR